MPKYLEIDVSEIIANPYQPRTTFDQESLNELSQSISENGIIQPIVVRVNINGKYEIVAGERRFKAANMAGLTKVPCIVSEYSNEESAKVALIENVQRENLTAIEEALAYQTLISMTGETQSELALTVGKTQSTIANKMRLLKLPEETQQAVRNRKISERHARAMLSIEDENQIVALTKRVIEENLTVAATEQLIKGEYKEKKKRGEKKTKNKIILTQNVRIALNTIREAVSMIEKAGIKVVMEETDGEDVYTIALKVNKHK